jgi:hypothetical protein
MDPELDRLAELGHSYVPQELKPAALFREELIPLLGLPGRDWTDRFSRGYRYEFVIADFTEHEVSVIIEISAVAKVAAAFFAYRDYQPQGGFVDECSDEPRSAKHRIYKQKADNFLASCGYRVLPWLSLNARYGDKTIRELLFFDVEVDS